MNTEEIAYFRKRFVGSANSSRATRENIFITFLKHLVLNRIRCFFAFFIESGKIRENLRKNEFGNMTFSEHIENLYRRKKGTTRNGLKQLILPVDRQKEVAQYAEVIRVNENPFILSE